MPTSHERPDLLASGPSGYADLDARHQRGPSLSDDSDHPVATTIGATIQIVVVVALVAVLLTFAVVSSQTIDIDSLWTEAEAPLIAVLAATAVAGGVIVELLRFRSRHD